MISLRETLEMYWSSVTQKEILQINLSLFREFSDALDSLRERKNEIVPSLDFEKMQLEVKEHVDSLAYGLAKLRKQWLRPTKDDAILLRDATTIIDNLKTLSLLSSDFNDKTMSEIGAMLKRLDAYRPIVDALLSFLNNRDTDDRKTNDDSKDGVTNLRNQEAEIDRGKANNKKNYKSKKGKGKGKK